MQFYKPEDEKILLPHNLKVIGHIEHLALTIGNILVDCSAMVTGECCTGSCKVYCCDFLLVKNMAEVV